MHKIITTALNLALLFILTACGAPELNIEEQQKLSKFNSKDMARLDERMQRANSDFELNYYAPLSFVHAQKSYKKFTKLKEQEFEKREDLFAYYLQTQKLIDYGLDSKEIVERKLEKLLLQKERLLQTKAYENFEERYDEFEESLSELIVNIDKRQTDELSDKSALLYNSSVALYADNMSYNYLNKYVQILKSLEDDGFANNAPRQYKIATQMLKKSEKAIKDDPDNTALCKSVRLKTKIEVLYAQLLANEVESLMKRDSITYEILLNNWHRSLEKIYMRSSTEGTIIYLPREEKVNILLNSMK